MPLSLGQQLEVVATAENFDADFYLAANPDVAAAIQNGSVASAQEHFTRFGRGEGRRLRSTAPIPIMRARKMQKLRPKLRSDLPCELVDGRPSFLSEGLRAETGISDTDRVSANSYDADVMTLVERYRDGLIVDVGAGKRDIYYENVVNYEIVNYDTTDVLGVGEELPFLDNSFDAVISVAVLEHVRDPFRCARELIRVLKPGGQLFCCVPFLQPLHGYPHHYYNMTHQGLRALFERDLRIDRHFTPDSVLPIWSLTWILRSWAEGLSEHSRAEFMNMRIADLIDQPSRYIDMAFVRDLSDAKNFELASATVIVATKQ